MSSPTDYNQTLQDMFSANIKKAEEEKVTLEAEIHRLQDALNEAKKKLSLFNNEIRTYTALSETLKKETSHTHAHPHTSRSHSQPKDTEKKTSGPIECRFGPTCTRRDNGCKFYHGK